MHMHTFAPRRIVFAFIALFLAIGVGGSAQPPAPATANASVGAAAPLQPSDRQRSIARRVYENLDRAHYAQVSLDDKMSSKIFDLYLESLDGARSYFMASDVAEFERLRLRFDDAIKTGALEPAFTIFDRFRQRNRERSEGRQSRRSKFAIR